MAVPAWQAFEYHVQDLLGLSSTPASGSQWNAPGDAVDNRHGSWFAVLADAKCTEKSSYSISAKFMRQSVNAAADLGKRFILPVRFCVRGRGAPQDYVVLTLDDFAELMEKAGSG